MKIVMVLYPGNGHKVEYGELEGQPVPDSDEGELGLRQRIKDQEHDLVVITDREGDEFYGELQDAKVLITSPFWPVYVTPEVMDHAPNLKLILTAGVGSDYVDLGEAANRNVTVAGQTAANIVSVAEHAAMCILNLVHNFVPQYNQEINGEWDIAGIAKKAYDLEGKTVGIYGAGAIGQLVAMRLRAFDVKIYYYKRLRLFNVEEEVCSFHYTRLDDTMVNCDVIVVEAPLAPETEGLFDRDVLFGIKKGACLVNTSRGAVVDRDALVEALEEGHLAR